MTDEYDNARLIEAILFQSPQPISERELARRLPDGADLPAVLSRLAADYAERGVILTRAGDSWAFNTATDLADRLVGTGAGDNRLPRAAIETLAVIAYHQPVTRGDIEEIRGVRLGRGTLDVLFDNHWIRLNGRRHTPGRPALWVTTDTFLRDFSLQSLDDLPQVDALSTSGLMDVGDVLVGHALNAEDRSEP